MGPSPGAERSVAMGELAVCRAGESLVARGVGSCVLILLHDAQAGLGGMAHAMLPRRGKAGDRPTKYVDAALERLVVEIEAAGASRARLTARLVGGAAMFRTELAAPHSPVGERNLAAARAELARLGIPLVASEVGGRAGRSVTFEAESGRVTVRQLERELTL